MLNALNEQINAEFWSAYLYLSMSCHFEAEGLSGIANWFKVQFAEEQAHARIFMNYVHARGGKVELKPIAEVPTKWESAKDAFVNTLDHERKVTGMIHALYALAEKEQDYASRQMLNWFIAEQVEEEETAQGLIDTLNLINGEGSGVYQFDRELASRTYTAPAILKD